MVFQNTSTTHLNGEGFQLVPVVSQASLHESTFHKIRLKLSVYRVSTPTEQVYLCFSFIYSSPPHFCTCRQHMIEKQTSWVNDKHGWHKQ